MSPLDGQITDFVQAPATVPDVFSLDGLIAWLETQPADETYSYGCLGGCLIHQYLTARGLLVNLVGGAGWYDDRRRYHIFPGDVAGHQLSKVGPGHGSPFNVVAIGAIEPRGYTYGAALQRAHALHDRGDAMMVNTILKEK